MNQEAHKYDDGKLKMELIPVEMMNAMARGFTYGAGKYSARNWELGLSWGRLFGSVLRHLFAFWGGDEIDKESGIPHLHLASSALAMLVATVDRHPENDDRIAGR